MSPLQDSALGLAGGLALGALLIVIAPPLEAVLVLALAGITLRSKLAHREQGTVRFVLLGLSSVTVVGLALALTL